MSAQALNVMFLCTGNSARSIMAEALLNAIGRGRFRAYSAGSHPAGRIHSMALEQIARNGLETEGLRSKSWDEFARAGAPKMDFVLTLCGSAAGEACPAWPGQQIRSHWGIDDPAAAQGGEVVKRRAFANAYGALQNRILVFTSLPLRKLRRDLLQKRLDEIGQMGAAGVEDPTSLADRIQAASRPLPIAPRRRRSVTDLLRSQS